MKTIEKVELTDQEHADYMKACKELNRIQLVVVDTENEVFEKGLSEEDFNELLGL